MGIDRKREGIDKESEDCNKNIFGKNLSPFFLSNTEEFYLRKKWRQNPSDAENETEMKKLTAGLGGTFGGTLGAGVGTAAGFSTGTAGRGF